MCKSNELNKLTNKMEAGSHAERIDGQLSVGRWIAGLDKKGEVIMETKKA